jgi:hypothetical protein
LTYLLGLNKIDGMKNIYMLFVVSFFLLACAKAPINQAAENRNTISLTVQEYQKQIKICDDEMEEKNNAENLKVWQMRNNFSTKLECYSNIINDIIKKHFADDSDMQKKSDSFIEASIGISHSIYDSNKDCYPHCGTMTIEQGQITNLHFMEFYIKQLLRQLESNEFVYGDLVK